jgi:enoyl-[acyl-carrier protein] reductase I
MILEGKKGLIFGVANKMSLAWHIAKEARAQGAEIQLCVANERFRSKVIPLAKELGGPEPLICDVTSDESVITTFKVIAERTPRVDFLVHAIAYAAKEDLAGRFIDTSRFGFHMAQDISAYSLANLAHHVEPMMPDGGSILTLSYIGSVRAVPNYNVMGVAKAALEACVRYLAVDLGPKGIRVNTLSAGPMKTLAASAVRGLREKLDQQAEANPLLRKVTGEDVGQAAAFLLSDMSSGITGDVMYVDCGYHITGKIGN